MYIFENLFLHPDNKHLLSAVHLNANIVAKMVIETVVSLYSSVEETFSSFAFANKSVLYYDDIKVKPT